MTYNGVKISENLDISGIRIIIKINGRRFYSSEVFDTMADAIGAGIGYGKEYGNHNVKICVYLYRNSKATQSLKIKGFILPLNELLINKPNQYENK